MNDKIKKPFLLDIILGMSSAFKTMLDKDKEKVISLMELIKPIVKKKLRSFEVEELCQIMHCQHVITKDKEFNGIIFEHILSGKI